MWKCLICKLYHGEKNGELKRWKSVLQKTKLIKVYRVKPKQTGFIKFQFLSDVEQVTVEKKQMEPGQYTKWPLEENIFASL